MSMKRRKCIYSVLLLSTLLLTSVLAVSAAPLQQGCNPLSGCVLRESGDRARWWANSWRRGTCGTGANNWIVTYNTDNSTWRNADISKMRFYAAGWSGYRYYPWAGQAQVIDNKTPGIVLCLGGILGPNDVRGTWVWLKP